ncbi:MAG TPA: single-stranded-DNA-specific exonuclease RecJ, partial [Desulfitobacteriaceae bacterium]|nr:single-stranded-DNA-specific exonuclease RecJ [Desulfitobacteriaceae bacterium]
MKKKWLISETKCHQSLLLRESLALSPIVADILVQRGLQEVRKAVDYLRPTMFNLASPFCFKDMSRLMSRLSRTHQNGDKVLVYGDFDVDGITGTALLYKTLVDLGFKAVTYIPHRQEEGYGLHRQALAKAAQAGVKLIITVDCGITAFEEVEFARELGLEVVITDHHEPPERLPAALAILNPKVPDSGYPFSELAGVGVAFKLAQALLQEFKTCGVGMQTQTELLDLVALGTIADVVPLIDENRVLVYHGLRQMEHSVHPGLEALLLECGLLNKTLKAGTIAFIMAPRLNAVGRMDSARSGLELLLTTNPKRAQELARKLSAENIRRQNTEKKILAEAMAQLPAEDLPRVIVLASAGWHHGVLGIVASRLAERYHRPVFMLGLEDKLAKGSARGIPGYHVLEQLDLQADLLKKYGGHRQAAGITLAAENISRLREGLNAEAGKLPAVIFQKKMQIDSIVDFAMLTASLQEELEQLAPFGYGNSGPVLAVRQLPVAKLSLVGENGSHLKLRLGPEGTLDGIAFRQGERLPELLPHSQLDLAFTLDINSFRGRQQLQLVVKDIQNKAEVQSKGDFAKIKAGDFQNFEGLDWRTCKRTDWVQKVLTSVRQNNSSSVLDSKTVVWDSSLGKIYSFEDYCRQNNFCREAESETKGEFSGAEWLEPQILGIIVGTPFSRADFKLGIETILRLGVQKIALAEFEIVTETELAKSGFSLSRQELIQKYRLFLNIAKEENPFCWKPSAADPDALEALKIFEELGLVRCLGSSDLFTIEFLPSNQKIDLELSLRYAGSKRYWERMKMFQKNLIANPWPEINHLIGSII